MIYQINSIKQKSINYQLHDDILMLMDPQYNQDQQQAFGYPTSQNPYPMQKPPTSKRTVYMMLGGGILIVILLLWIVFGGKSTPGQSDMQEVVQNTSDAVGILDDYQENVAFSGTKNDLALTRIIIRGNYQNLNALYVKTYKPKKSFSASPKPDKASRTSLDEAQRDNRLDSEIVTVLKTKVSTAYAALLQTKKNFKSKKSLETINKAQEDLESVSEILNDQ